MSASLRFVGVLMVLGVIGAIASGSVQHRQENTQARRDAEAMTGGRVDAGKQAIPRYGCGACHDIPGIAGADGVAGPPLGAVATRAVIAGRFPNDAATLMRWVRRPEHLSPGTAMPEQPMPAQDARDIAANLLTLR